MRSRKQAHRRWRPGVCGLAALLLLAGRGAVLHGQAPEAPDPNVTHAGRVDVPAGRMAALCSTMVTPSFPPGADRSKGRTVVIRALVHHTGLVQPLYAVAGAAPADRGFESAAMTAVRLYRFHPYMVDGQPADVMTEIAVTFLPGQPGGLISHPHP